MGQLVISSKKVLLIIQFIVLCMFALSAKAENRLSENSVFFSFNEYCINKAHDFKSIKANAKILGWPELSKDQLVALRPLDSTELRGWIASRKGIRFLLTLNTVEYPDIIARACTIISYDVSAQILDDYVHRYLIVDETDTEDMPMSFFPELQEAIKFAR